jgi:16S rRNA (guanine966-N2)-methyltransferase
MRIIAGSARSVPLHKLTGNDIRPTPDRVRESIFSILTPYLDETTIFLDCCTGTGINALEALSRGAKQAILLDCASESLSIARKNAEKTKLAPQCRFVRGAIPEKLNYVARQFPPANIVYADPPYAYPDYTPLLEALCTPNLLSPEAIVLIEHDSKRPLPEQVGNLQQFRIQTYGNIQVTFYNTVPDSQ